jgi:hypothetical protein
MMGKSCAKYCKLAWNPMNVYVEIVASLIIVISFIWNTNILSHPKKNIWSVLSITEISLFWLVHPTLNVTMSCCVTPYILVKSGKKNYQSFVGTYCPILTGRTRYAPYKDDVGFSEINFCKTTLSTALTVLLAIFAVQVLQIKFTWRSIRRLNVGSPTGYETLIYLWSGQVRTFFLNDATFNEMKSTYAFAHFC